jgi:hypothetical protein
MWLCTLAHRSRLELFSRKTLQTVLLLDIFMVLRFNKSSIGDRLAIAVHSLPNLSLSVDVRRSIKPEHVELELTSVGNFYCDLFVLQKLS